MGFCFVTERYVRRSAPSLVAPVATWRVAVELLGRVGLGDDDFVKSVFVQIHGGGQGPGGGAIHRGSL